jgi:hypothetical protein
MSNYHKSARWRRLKNKHKKRYNWCVYCHSKTNLTVHHRKNVSEIHKVNSRYRNETMNDLITLCENCHTTLHRIHNKAYYHSNSKSNFNGIKGITQIGN